MPLLMCPNDNAAMQTLDRNGVQFDMCPTCRGVWLDRGELEKLMASAAEEGRATAPQAAPQPTYQQPIQQQPHQQPHQQPWGGGQPQGYREPPRYKDDDRHRDGGYYKKKKRMDIFDIFD
ncbi:Zn-finger nucleic acid-binding protein [Brevundimonas bullata]|uniref:Zn-finger nucleic acid-binding protein n=1 Tax=Brevundimonas bullata TaxID=13160 RepID=A0A7W7IM08_9CAUL|nr:zf-TFIIB domain-containing protein [Brevundimonas bullata]MBB4796810.1 Zn-finger nucleic acid-binding protein [Brevundimonas bullata]MBB6381769.1 Zn-finger nucleic acid-binding protein [Brevundimonas bullata]